MPIKKGGQKGIDKSGGRDVSHLLLTYGIGYRYGTYLVPYRIHFCEASLRSFESVRGYRLRQGGFNCTKDAAGCLARTGLKIRIGT